MKRILKHRRLLIECAHAILAALALTAAFLLRFEFTLDGPYRHMLAASLPLLLAIKLIVFRAFGLRDLAWRFLGFRDLLRLAAANAAAACLVTIALRIVIGPALPRSVHILDALLCFLLMIAVRAAGRLFFDLRPFNLRAQPNTDVTRTILIYGAGKAGVTLLNEISANPRIGYRVAGFIDDSSSKRNQRIHGARVLGTGQELPAIVKKHRVTEVLIALASVSGSQLSEILEHCRAAAVPAKKIPALSELIHSRVLVNQIREIRLEDLLGRLPVSLDQSGIRARLAGGVVLITGAGGSIGSELCRQIAPYQPAAIVGYDHAETALYQIDQEMRERFPGVRFVPEVGCIRNRRRLAEVFAEHAPRSVYHAAAYKHVPMMEAHLFEAIENNVCGTQNTAAEAVRAGVRDFVLVSSDKAVRPANVMGATKRLAELVCAGQVGQHGQAGQAGRTRFMAVRFGNVLGSNGSVIPLFQRQIAAGGPVTVTHPEMRRFFMTIPEAAQLVLQAAALSRASSPASHASPAAGGEIFVLNMGEPVRIVDLARNLVLLSGLDPERDIRIEFSGIRPGEKLYEELSAIEEDTVATPHSQIRIFLSPRPSLESLTDGLARLRRAIDARDAASAVLTMKELVPDYNPSTFILRRAMQTPEIEKAKSVAV